MGKNDPLFVQVSDYMKETHKCNIVEIKVIQNIPLWIKYCNNWSQLEYKYNKKIKTKRLFHGTKNTEPKQILQSEIGFDLNYARDGYYGRGIYFHKEARYSHNYYYKEGNIK